MSTSDSGFDWQATLAPYAKSSYRRGLLDVATSVVPYLALSVAMYLALSVSWLITLALAVPAAGFLVRTFCLFHDCTHGSLLPSRGKRLAGHLLRPAAVVAVRALAPRSRGPPRHLRGPRQRGVGDIRTLTVSEFDALPSRGRLATGCSATRC